MLATIGGWPVHLINYGSKINAPAWLQASVDYLRATLNRMHCPLLGLGVNQTIESIKEQLYTALSSPDRPSEIIVIGLSGGSSASYSAIYQLARDHPEIIPQMRQHLIFYAWGSPETEGTLEQISNQLKELVIYKRKNDFITSSIGSFGGIFFPVAFLKGLTILLLHGNQHHGIYYLEDYSKDTSLHNKYASLNH